MLISTTRSLALLGLCLGVAACSPRMAAKEPTVALRFDGPAKAESLDVLIARAGTSKDVQVIELGRTAWLSEHLAVVRTAEKPHYHRFHDSTVFLLRGQGTLVLEQKHLPMRAGDVAHIQRGVPHFFKNEGGEPAAAFVIFSPPFDGKDVVAAEDAEPKLEPVPAKRSRWWPF